MTPDQVRRRRRWPWVVAGAVVLLVAAGVTAFVVVNNEPGDVVNEDVPFQAESDEAPRPVETERGRVPRGFRWPTYGFTKSRTRYLPLATPIRPPFAERWKLGGKILLEFPPAMGGQMLFLLKNNAALYGIRRQTGKKIWKSKVGYLAASQPAYDRGTIFVTVLERGKGIKQGRVAAYGAGTGRTRWSRKLPSRSESSPLVHQGNVYFGSEDGTVYALRASDGFVRWRYKAKGAVKAGLAYADGKLYFGDYAGEVTALRASDGQRVWKATTRNGRFGLSSGRFYSTPAVDFGRVYVGGTDGFVYSFATGDGKLAWRKKTGGFVYGSPAVAKVPGGQPTVYIGSYDKKFYALDARNGRVRWSRQAEGRVSGGAQVIGDLVFYSTLRKTTTALGARTGDRVWSTKRGGFNPVVSNGRGLFLVGYTSLFGLDARPRSARAQRSAGRRYRSALRRVARRQAQVRRRNALRRRGVRWCARVDGRRVCRRPAPLVCVKRADGRTICRPRKPVVCFRLDGGRGKQQCRPRK